MSGTDYRDDAVVALIEADLEAFWLALCGLPGGEVHRDPEMTWYASGIPGLTLNGVLRARFRDEARADARVDATLAHFRARGLPFWWWVGPSSAPADLAERLRLRGFTSLGDAPGMAMAAASVPRVGVEGLAVERVTTPTGLDEFVRVLVSGFGGDALQRYGVAVHAGPCLGGDPRFTYLLGRMEERPVATAIAFTGAGAAGVYAVSTVPEARRRGLGAALTAAAVDAGRRAGCRVATLQSSPEGLGVYRRLGFREHCTFRRFAAPSP